MLRRKLFLVLGSLVALMLIASVAAILLLQSVLESLDHINRETLDSTVNISRLSTHVSTLENELNLWRLGKEVQHTEILQERVGDIQSQIKRFDGDYMRDPQVIFAYERFVTLLPKLSEDVSRLPDLGDETEVDLALARLQITTSVLRERIADLARETSHHTEDEQHILAGRFRTIVVCLAIIFLFLINITIIVLLHTATMILKPINVLTRATRKLAREEFDFRIVLDQHDEFDELAQAYNSMAEQLMLSEQRKMDTLQQVARTLNHELNNALAVIKLQLRLLEKSSSGEHSMAKPLWQIRETLEKIAKTVESLKHVRRIVLTDYVSGVKMLDLERSVEENPLIETSTPESMPENKPHDPPPPARPTITPVR